MLGVALRCGAGGAGCGGWAVLGVALRCGGWTVLGVALRCGAGGAGFGGWPAHTRTPHTRRSAHTQAAACPTQHTASNRTPPHGLDTPHRDHGTLPTPGAPAPPGRGQRQQQQQQRSGSNALCDPCTVTTGAPLCAEGGRRARQGVAQGVARLPVQGCQSPTAAHPPPLWRPSSEKGERTWLHTSLHAPHTALWSTKV